MAQKKQVPLPMNAGLVEAAIRRHVDYRANMLIPEASIRYGLGGKVGEYRADFMMITRAGYGTELEVKVSRADWRADLTKEKWVGMPNWVTRFIYVVPAELGIPDFVPAHAGVWHVIPRAAILDRYSDQERHGFDGYDIKTVRAPHLLGREKVPQVVIGNWLRNLYYRYWEQRISIDGRIARAVREGVA